MLIGQPELVALERRVHRRRRMSEGAERAPREPQHEVEGAHVGTRAEMARRIAEDERVPGVVRSGAEQPLVVRIAADDPVHDDHVGGLDARALREVVDAPVNPVSEPGFLGKPACLRLVGWRQLEVERSRRARLHELDSDLADAPADLEHARPGEPSLAQESGHALGGRVEPPAPVAVRSPPGEAPVEEARVVAGPATARHLPSVARTETSGGVRSQVDVALFTEWAERVRQRAGQLARFYEERFRDEFAPAFAAWRATDPAGNPDAPKSPFAIPEYKLAATARSDGFLAEAEASTAEAQEANQRADTSSGV